MKLEYCKMWAGSISFCVTEEQEYCVYMTVEQPHPYNGKNKYYSPTYLSRILLGAREIYLWVMRWI
jgi:hypothetical protein